MPHITYILADASTAARNANPTFAVFIACLLACLFASIYLRRTRKTNEWEASSLRAQDRVLKEQKEQGQQPNSSNTDATKREKGAFQKFIEYPFLQSYLGIGIGFFVPALLIIILAGEQIEDTRYELVVFYGAVFVWNVVFTLLFKFRLKLPMIPIPITWAAIPFLGIALWDMCFGLY